MLAGSLFRTTGPLVGRQVFVPAAAEEKRLGHLRGRVVKTCLLPSGRVVKLAARGTKQAILFVRERNGWLQILVATADLASLDAVGTVEVYENHACVYVGRGRWQVFATKVEALDFSERLVAATEGLALA